MSAFDNVCAALVAVKPLYDGHDGIKRKVPPRTTGPLNEPFFNALKAHAEHIGYPVSVTPPPTGWDNDEHDGTTHHAPPKEYVCNCGRDHSADVGIWVRYREWPLLAHELCHALRGDDSVNPKPVEVCARMVRALGLTQDTSSVDHTIKSFWFVRNHFDAFLDWVKRLEEWTVELAVAMACDRLGFEYEFSVGYLARYDATPKGLSEVRHLAEPLADTLVSLLTKGAVKAA